MESTQTTTKAMKYDGEKPRMDLVDRYAVEELAKVLTFGAQKYAAHNWRNGLEYSRLIAAALRHIHAFNDGEDLDPESGLPHPAHAMCCLMFLLGTMKHMPTMDDRWRVVDTYPTATDNHEPLDEEEIIGMTCGCVDDGTFNLRCAIDLARAVEEKHGIA